MSNFLTASLKRLVSPSLALLTAIALAPCAANATPYVVKVVQQGNKVVAVGSGAFDLTGLTIHTRFTTAGDVPGLFGNIADEASDQSPTILFKTPTPGSRGP